ncbi:MAG: N-acetylmuramoyl-L-alanine amidase, partial [Clostridiales bacterium]|nr:N-acetylmuramoyl-L-alanine amidase [Candidatus Equinaster intestinalis]
ALILAAAAGVTFFVTKKAKNLSAEESSSRVSTESVISSEISSETEEPIQIESSSEPEKEKLLEITVPAKQTAQTTEPSFSFKGSCDGEFEVLLNGEPVKGTEKGVVSVTVELKAGKNTFKFTHKGKDYTYTINYKYTVLKSVSPAKSGVYSGGSVITVNADARAGANVSATFMGKTVTLKKAVNQDENDEFEDSEIFTNFSGTFTLPESNLIETSLGKIKVTASCGGVTQTLNSGEIRLKKNTSVKPSDPAVTPKGANYIDVGSGLIATIVADSAETFDGNTTDDLSRPTNNYLPKGTQDYCAEGTVSNGDNTYYKLRCGRRVYTTTYPDNSYKLTVATTSLGKLPDHNEIKVSSFQNDGQYQYLKLDTLWKAPFYFELKDQNYTNAKYQDYTFSSVTFSYIDITFCYATVMEGEISLPENNPIFKSAEIIKNQYDYTLRLHLNKVGGFYGWNAFYDNDGKLVFKFLNPAKMENPDSLSGIKIFIDVGHGGSDSGAQSFGKGQYEKTRNLYLAGVLKTKLEALGATVIMDRTEDKFISPPNRMELIRNAGADFCIAIHHDYSSNASRNGFGSYHFTPYSKVAADLVDEKMDATGIFRTDWKVRFHYFYGARVTDCPVVLTENGFMSNQQDYYDILDPGINDKKAQALTDAILSYFRSIQ